MSEPVKNEAADVYVQLVDITNPDFFVIDPTIAAGDFQLSGDGGALANLTNLPVVTPAGSTFVLLDLTADEMNFDNVNILGSDQSADEWQDIGVLFQLDDGSAGSVYDIVAGDHIEDHESVVVNKKGTTTAVLSKEINGSLLTPGVTITTVDN